MLKKILPIIVFIMLIYGIYLIHDWYYRQQFYKEGNTLEEISLDELSVGNYVSFYIDDYVKKEISSPEGKEYSGVSMIYVERGIEYEIYTMLIEAQASPYEDVYIQVMVKDQETKQKLKNLEQGKVYFEGELISAPFELYEFDIEWYSDTYEGIYLNPHKLINNIAIKQIELPDEGYGLYIGIALVILALVGYCILGRIKGNEPDVEIKSDKFTDYNIEYSTYTYNIRNDLMCEKDNLKNLQAEQIEHKKVCNIMIVIFIVGLIIYFNASAFLIKLFSFIPMYIGIGGIWSRFINSSNDLAVYIVKRRRKRSIYLDIAECKKNIEMLERIIEKKNL